MVEQGRSYYISRINFQLGVLAETVKLNSTDNRNDLAVDAEDTVCGLMNKVFDLQLVNANKEHHNYPAVDLVDTKNRIAFQITVQNDVKKVDDMLEKFEKHNLKLQFNRLVLFVISEKDPTKSMRERETVRFCGATDIWNLKTVRDGMKGMSVDQLKRIAEYLEQEVGTLEAKAQEENRRQKEEGQRKNQEADLNKDQEIKKRRHKRILQILGMVGAGMILLAAIVLGIREYGQYIQEMEQRNTMLMNTFANEEMEQNEFAFNTEAKRNEIGSITFMDSMRLVPEDQANVVDVSKLQQGDVLAWVEPNGDLYDLYIAAKGTIYAPDDASNLFRDMINLKTIQFGKAFSTKNTTNMNAMFYNCKSLKELDISHFDTNQVTDMSYLFKNCTVLTQLNLEKLSTVCVTTMESMFDGCAQLAELKLGEFDTASVTNMAYMFNGCSSIANLPLNTFDTSNVTNMRRMFAECTNISELKLGGFDTSNVTDMYAMFYKCEELNYLVLVNFDTSKVTDMSYMFQECTKLKRLDISSFDTANVTKMNNMFGDCKKLENLVLSHFDTSKVTGMEKMFYGCSALTVLFLDNFDTSNVTNMCAMFYECTGLTKLEISGFDTRRVVDMSHMFQGCAGLKSLNLSNFKTPCTTDMQSMFSGCTSLEDVDVENFDTSNVTNMGYMFSYCTGLPQLDLRHFNTENVELINNMFAGWGNTAELNISGWDLNSVTFYKDFMPEGMIVEGQPWEELFD